MNTKSRTGVSARVTRLVLFGAVGSLALAAASEPALGQTAAGTPQQAAPSTPPPQAGAAAPASGSSMSGEIVVTARRRSESLERVPVSVTALGSADLAARGVTDQAGLQQAVPGLTIRETENSNQLDYSLRGQSIDAFSGSHPAVLTYTNDVQMTAQSASSLYDLDSVQVLKGPQGTLFGRNVTGGAILFNTKKPTDDLDGFATVRLGNYNLKEILGAANVPIVADKVLLRVAGDIESRDGFQHNVFNGENYGAQERQSLRATLVVRPTERLQNTTVVEYDRSDGSNVNPVGYSAYPCGATHNGAALNTAAACNYSSALDTALGSPGAFAKVVAAHPGSPPGGLVSFIAQQHAMGPWDIDVNSPDKHQGHNFYMTNTTTYDLTPDLQIKNILGYANSLSKDQQDKDGTPYTIQEQFNGRGSNGNLVTTGQGSDELQLLGKTFDKNLNFVIGAYYAFESDRQYQDDESFILTPVLPAPNINDTDYRTSSWTQAIYAQGTYDLSQLTGVQGLSFTGGFRYSWEQDHINPFPLSRYAGAPSEAKSFSDPSWQVGVEYQVNSHLLLYVENRGSWRAGGFNGSSPPILGTAAQGGNLFLPETTYDVEVGEKYVGDVFGHRTRLNIALYNQWISNVQRAIYLVLPTGLSAITANIPEANVRGVEVEAQSKVTSWLDVGLTSALTDAQYTQPSVNLFSQLFTVGPYGDAPKLSGTVYGQINFPTPSTIGRVSLRTELYEQTAQYFTNLGNTSNPGARLPGYGLLNFRVDWRDIAGSRVSLAAFMKNATDKPYYVGGTSLGAAFGLNVAIPGEPRTFGLELGYRF